MQLSYAMCGRRKKGIQCVQCSMFIANEIQFLNEHIEMVAHLFTANGLCERARVCVVWCVDVQKSNERIETEGDAIGHD